MLEHCPHGYPGGQFCSHGPLKSAPRYKQTVQHGESGTVWYVVDTWAPEGQQPAVVASGTDQQRMAHVAYTLNHSGEVRPEIKES